MLLDDLLKAGIVQPCELGQVMNVGDYVVDVIFQEQEIFLAVLNVFLIHGQPIGQRFGSSILFHAMDDLPDLSFGRSQASDGLFGLDALEGENLVELRFEFAHKSFFIVFSPRPSWGVRLLRRWIGLIRSLETVLEVIISDVVVIVVMY